jgi:hypothetical protein
MPEISHTGGIRREKESRMRINVAHLREQGIDFAVFDADASDHTETGRERLLAQLTGAARLAGLKVDKSALAFRTGSGIEFFGTADLVRFLARAGIPGWTHSIDV